MDDAKLDYLSIVKTWSFYGTTFFPPCKVQGGAKNLPSKVVIGVNYEGIRLYKPKNKVYFSLCLSHLLAIAFSLLAGAHL